MTERVLTEHNLYIPRVFEDYNKKSLQLHRDRQYLTNSFAAHMFEHITLNSVHDYLRMRHL